MPGGRTWEAKLSARTAVNLQQEFEVKASRCLNFSLMQEGSNFLKERIGILNKLCIKFHNHLSQFLNNPGLKEQITHFSYFLMKSADGFCAASLRTVFSRTCIQVNA